MALKMVKALSNSLMVVFMMDRGLTIKSVVLANIIMQKKIL